MRINMNLSMYPRLAIIAAALLLQSCAQPPAVAPPIVSTPPPPTAPKEVVILVSEDIPAYTDVAKALARKLGKRSSIRYLNGTPPENSKLLAAYRTDEDRQFVSIGLGAALAAKTLTNRQVVFCQVFNYQDYELVTALHKGVSMTPSLHRSFDTWRALAPKAVNIGVISGPGFEDLIEAAKVAARSYGITLHHTIVNSDKEYEFAYKQMSDKVQGYWLIPDNRVLSGNVLRNVLSFSIRNSKPVEVFNEELLGLGGLFSITNDHQDIAQEVLRRLEQAQDAKTIPGPDIVYPDQSILHINAMMAQRLNLKIPAHYRKYAHAL